MTSPERRKLLTELKDLSNLKKLYRKHVESKIKAISKIDERVVVIRLLLTTDPD